MPIKLNSRGRKTLILMGSTWGFPLVPLRRYSNGKLQRRSNTLRISRCIAFSSIHFFRVDGFTKKNMGFVSDPMQVQLALRWWIPVVTVSNLRSKRGHGFQDETRFQVYNSTELKTLQGYSLALQWHEGRRMVQGCRGWNTISQVSTLPSTNNLRHCPPKKTSSPNLRHWLWLRVVFKDFLFTSW